MSSWFTPSAVADPQARANAKALQEEALALYVELNDAPWHRQMPLGARQPRVLGQRGEAASDHFARCEKLFREGGNRFGLSWCRHMTGLNLLQMHDTEATRAAFEEAVALFLESMDVSGIVLCIDDFAQLESDDGNMERAVQIACIAEVLELRSGVKLACVSNRLGRPGRASEDMPEAEHQRIRTEVADITLQDAADYAISQISSPTT